MAQQRQRITKVLIANRGEIAVRVARACRELSLPSVAVFSDADRAAPHVRAADEAVRIGEPEAAKSYLNIDNVVAAAKQTGADAVHPGYGFLAENPAFARRCAKEGITFIGPSPEVMERVGDKIAARRTMGARNVPITPGMTERTEDVALLKREAQRVGFPLVIKASAGGGGKGMNIVERPEDLEERAAGAIRVAKSAFGDGAVFLEKYLRNPRHIEIQIAADRHGNIVHLFERECSIQRRYQKLVEESPSPALDETLRRAIGAAAVEVARAAGYDSVGTVEFLLDEKKHFYFMEVNARIQVEHPVTEMTTGIDIVKTQIRIAAGDPLPFTQDDIRPRGHAIECRVYAEDPANGFTPSPGRILFLREPSGPGLRVDSGVESGFEVPPWYDPILAKVVVASHDRPSALRRMALALRDYPILGIATTAGYLANLMEHPLFAKGEITTDFIARHGKDLLAAKADFPRHAAVAAALIRKINRRRPSDAASGPEIPSPWRTVTLAE